jgi:membrane-bound lytic murein transglycosylase B
MATTGDYINNAASKYGVPTSILNSLVVNESAGNPNARGAAGEIGLTQIMPSTAKGLGYSPAELWDPQTNVNAGAGYLAGLYQKYGSWTAALSAYNSGSPSSSAGQSYAARVLQGIDTSALTTTNNSASSAPGDALAPNGNGTPGAATSTASGGSASQSSLPSGSLWGLATGSSSPGYRTYLAGGALVVVLAVAGLAALVWKG